ncbi:family 3 adenylate cyclase [Terriglobus roseus DSM 18391]|uniref:Family 3 adenylate cyclase n=1 Tax=Terriglobus roseus (strain DSM 18391 / NRRL B-41598 / KBS 63) TaxID=926566 RepID=I3ZCF3_TERRK|nr:adenylate/guanylate cyclase domain-containing protein [Terriglobus roseus]AFL86921.1 family 3 adenylate cyclase [Terriglobus roseus DSM 18391]
MSEREIHQQGQLRAELFEEAMALLLPRMFPRDVLMRNFVVPKKKYSSAIPPFNADFVLNRPDGTLVLFEVKAPYTEHALDALERTITRLLRAISEMPKNLRVAQVILAIAAQIPPKVSANLRASSKQFRAMGVELVIWDASYLVNAFRDAFKTNVGALAVEDIEHLLFTQGQRKPVNKVHLTVPGDIEPDAQYGKETIVLSADFCSYSTFVRATRTDPQLGVAIMGRFYRESRRIVELHGGRIDKFIGDALLVFWLADGDPTGLAHKVRQCASDLIGMSSGLAKEWQDEVDTLVTPIGMRIGAAVGPLLFIPEGESAESPVHAIGEAINFAVRLSKMEPNQFTVSNRLRKLYFQNDQGFIRQKAARLRGMSEEVIYWEMDMSAEVSGEDENDTRSS